MAVNQFLGVRFENRFGVARLPAAPKLVQILDSKPPFAKEKLLYSPTLSGVTQPGASYVVGDGSNAKRLRLALLDVDGKLYVFDARVGNLGGRFHRAR
jgi:hypothetical protein